MASAGASDECFACESNEYSLLGSSICSSCRPGHYYREPSASETEPCFTATLWDQYGDGWDDNVLQIIAEHLSTPLYSLSYPKPFPYTPGAASITASVCLPAGQQFTAHIPEGPRHWQIAWDISSPDLALAESIRVTDSTDPYMKDVSFWVPSVDTETLCLPCPEATFSAAGAPSLSACHACAEKGTFASTGSSFCSTAGAGHKANEDRTAEVSERSELATNEQVYRAA